MKNTKVNILIAITSLFALACNNKEKKPHTTLDDVVDKGKKEISSSSFGSPCELIALEDIKTIFTLADFPIET